MSLKDQYAVSNEVYNTSIEERDNGGVSRPQALDWNKAGREIDFKEDKFKPEHGEKYKLNILPYIIKSDLNPLVKKRKAKVGQAAYMLDLYVHRSVGPENADIVCPKENYGKPCPICEEYKKLMDDAESDDEKKEAGVHRAKRRAYLNVQLIEKGIPQDVQFFDVSHFRFMKELLEEAAGCGNGDEPLNFAHPVDGKIVEFRAAKSDFSKFDTMFKSFNFRDREEEIEDEALEATISFDELVILHDYETINAIMWGEEVPEKEDAPAKETSKEEPKEEAKEEKKEVGEDECPEGFTFGEDFENDLEKCDNCCDCDNDRWKLCRKAYKKLNS
jgi:hypothetical protein